MAPNNTKRPNIHHHLQSHNPAKFSQIGIFGLKKCHLANLTLTRHKIKKPATTLQKPIKFYLDGNVRIFLYGFLFKSSPQFPEVLVRLLLIHCCLEHAKGPGKKRGRRTG
jgi:hypothetical protein